MPAISVPATADMHEEPAIMQIGDLPDELLARALLSCRPDTREGFLQRLPRGRARSLRPLLKQYAGLGAELIQQSANDVLLMVRRMAASGDIVLSGELRLASPATAGES